MQNIAPCFMLRVSASLPFHPTTSLWGLYSCHAQHGATPRRRQVLLTSDHWIGSFYRSEYSQVFFLIRFPSPSPCLVNYYSPHKTHLKPHFLWETPSWQSFYLFLYLSLCLCSVHVMLSSWVQTSFPSCCRYLLPLSPSPTPVFTSTICNYCNYSLCLMRIILFVYVYKLYRAWTHVFSNVCKCAVLKLSLFLLIFFIKYCVFKIHLSCSYSR